ncbi:MAG: histone deacetylase [Actinomycetota bacterium]|nr:histone deacetylase [Actinomycetota bacterium]
MSILLAHHQACALHDPGADHPERPERLQAVADGARLAGVGDALVEFTPRAANREELARVHDLDYLARVEWRSLRGEALEPETMVGPASFEAARRAAGAGLDALERLDAGGASAAFLAVRPPGHHAMYGQAMGFCLFNNIAVTAAALVARGERVLIVDWDAHHGNGTQATFYDEANVLFVSMHQYPAYPGTGALDEIGDGAGRGATINLPFAPGATGDSYRRAFDTVIVPAAERFAASWLLVSAGFDAHRADPLTDLGLSAGDFADLTARAMQLAPPGRRIFFLEGGYDLEALAASVAATLAALAGEKVQPEPPSRSSFSQRATASDATAAKVCDAAIAAHEDALSR